MYLAAETEDMQQQHMNALQCLWQVPDKPDQAPSPPKSVESMAAEGKWTECQEWYCSY